MSFPSSQSAQVLLPNFSEYFSSTTTDSTVAITTSLAILLALISAYVTFGIQYDTKAKGSGIHTLGGFSVLTAWPFFTKRYDFLMYHWKRTGEKIFQFNVLQHRVVAISGEEGRKAFFNDKNLNFNEGYRILMGGAPAIDEIDIHTQDELEGARNNNKFNQRLQVLLSRKRLDMQIPTLLEDMHDRMKDWGDEGQFNPFTNIYELVFQMTVRMGSCRSLASNRAETNRLASLYWRIEKSATPIKLLLPWFPSKEKKESARCTKELYEMLDGYVEERKKAPEGLGSDAIDMMLLDELPNSDIIQFVLGVIFAGVINTGINSCWVLLYIAANPEWKEKLRSEFTSLLATHSSTSSNSTSKSHQPLYVRLSSIPASSWEDSTPLSDLVIRETLRLTTCGTALRRNINVADHETLVIGGKKVPKGAFLAYTLGDVHLDEEIYPQANKFDPRRFELGYEGSGSGAAGEKTKEGSGSLTYLGWGAGRHPCAGMKVAKLEIKMILALFLLGYEFELVDKAGNYPKTLPVPDRNDLQQARPLGESCYFKFRKVQE